MCHSGTLKPFILETKCGSKNVPYNVCAPALCANLTSLWNIPVLSCKETYMRSEFITQHETGSFFLFCVSFIILLNNILQQVFVEKQSTCSVYEINKQITNFRRLSLQHSNPATAHSDTWNKTLNSPFDLGRQIDITVKIQAFCINL
jgi:hypothetical protein